MKLMRLAILSGGAWYLWKRYGKNVASDWFKSGQKPFDGFKEEKRDIVDQASVESFPASDAPAYSNSPRAV